MIKIDWKKDYQKEFLCFYCEKGQFILNGQNKGSTGKHIKRSFVCSNLQCKKSTLNSCDLHPSYLKNLLSGYGFACPNKKCHARQMKHKGTSRGKKSFVCQKCKTTCLEFISLTKINLSKFSNSITSINQFDFENEKWDLRAINTSNNPRDRQYIVNFGVITSSCIKLYTKKYIYGLCKQNKPFVSIIGNFHILKHFSDYLSEKNIIFFDEISRNLILDFLAWGNNTNRVIELRLRVLRKLFETGNVQGWFQIDQDIIRDSDYPKQKISNPDPIPDVVREQIEKNLHKLPDPIARMWIICFFAAMRPYELALLKKDCLEQVGDKWKLVWWRKKGKKFHQHSVPITTTIAKVVQEQLEYIQNLWGKDWEYLFCHYHNVSKTDLTHPGLKAVKKVIPIRSPLMTAIRTLIKTEDIRDDNGQLAKFKLKLIRETRLTELFLKGHDLSVVSAWAGHRQLATTANFYTQVTCEQIEKEVGYIQSTLVNADGKKIYYESMPKSFWENPVAHELEIAGTHVNTPIYGYCGLDLDEECDKFRACYTCRFFVAKPEKLSQYIQQRDELREKQERALASGHGVLVEQFARQADQLDKIIASLQEAA